MATSGRHRTFTASDAYAVVITGVDMDASTATFVNPGATRTSPCDLDTLIQKIKADQTAGRQRDFYPRLEPRGAIKAASLPFIREGRITEKRAGWGSLTISDAYGSPHPHPPRGVASSSLPMKEARQESWAAVRRYEITNFGRPSKPPAARRASASISLPSIITVRVWRRSPILLDGSPSTSKKIGGLAPTTAMEPNAAVGADQMGGGDGGAGQGLGGGEAGGDVEFEFAHQLQPRAVGARDDRHPGPCSAATRALSLAKLAR